MRMRYRGAGILATVALLSAVAALVVFPVGAKAYPECETAECRREQAEEEAFVKQGEREHREYEEEQAALEREEREREHKEEREIRERKRRERHEAQEWAVKPRVSQKLAHEYALSLLHGQIPTWTYRTAGTLQCGGGKISRSQWRCRVSWIAGSVCHAGRVRVIGAGHEHHRAIYRSKIEYRNGYGDIRHGRIRCYFTEED